MWTRTTYVNKTGSLLRAAAFQVPPALPGERLEQRRNNDALGSHLAPDLLAGDEDGGGTDPDEYKLDAQGNPERIEAVQLAPGKPLAWRTSSTTPTR